MSDTFDELDLLAYADGRVTGERARRIAAYLQENPDLQRRVQDFARQDRELHERFDRYAEEPLPDSLARLFDETPSPRTTQRPVVRALAASVVMGLAGMSGWWIGQTGGGTDDTASFAKAAAERFSAGDPASSGIQVAGNNATANGASLLRGFSERVSLELQVPDLSAHGYRLVDKQKVDLDGATGIALRYVDERGQNVQVYLKTRWRDPTDPVQKTSRDGVAVTFWDDGPIAVAVTAPSSADGQIQALTEDIQRALGSAPARDRQEIPRP
jgi:anti-sigma factor RsiW